MKQTIRDHQQRTVDDSLTPSFQVLVKLGSIVVHYQELNSPGGDPMDKKAIDTLESDPEVIEWLAKMTKLAFLPVKR